MWSGCLSRVRIEVPNEDDMKLLESRKLCYHPDKDLTDAFHVFYTRYEVSSYNEEKLNSLETPQITINYIPSYPEHYSPKIDTSGAIDNTNFQQVRMIAEYHLSLTYIIYFIRH